MNLPLETILSLIILTDLALLGVGRLGHLLRLAALQGALLASTPLLIAGTEPPEFHLLLLCLAVFLIKAVGFPLLLAKTMRKIGVPATVESYVGFGPTVACGLAGLAVSFWLESRLQIPAQAFFGLLIPASLTTILAGLLLIIARRKALTQVVGYLIMENGIFLFGAPMSSQNAVWVELSILLDVFVAVFVMGIAIHHINRTFESIDVDRFCSLRD